MDATPRAPWNPAPRWADPLILLLALVATLFATEALVRSRQPKPPAERISLVGRALELQAAAQALLPVHRAAPKAAEPREGWDRALMGVLLAEAGRVEAGRPLAFDTDLPSDSGEAFRRVWRAAYEGAPGPSEADLAATRKALANGWAARLMAARIAPEPDRPTLREGARTWARPRLIAFGLASVVGVVLALGGLVAAPFLLFSRPASPPVLPRWRLPWRAVLLVVLFWFLALRLSGLAASLILALIPLPGPWLLPLAFLFHAAVGLGLLAWAEGRSIRQTLGPALGGRPFRAAGWGLVFLAVGVAAVLAAGLLAAPFTGPGEPPQRELMDLIGGAQGALTTTLLFLTVAGLAPAFEEVFFRGFLLPWLHPRLASRWGARWGTLAALVLTSLAFGAMHLQPRGLHTLSTLGLVLGWALVRSGDLRSAILVHAAWNGGIFLLVKTLA